ncbi:putative ABC transport system permease protein [Halalkalibacter nanhaiisediminis]|uniref:Putative ABC transport system permease protein n=2 Tax=Halalkalibacter nanhaiisediminis TaxID=688079 RepID=A0A562QS43_9BACI|nr:putative ABC transport system permease protein [Halalkalibacter nanhaiisediminis]
MLFKVKIGLIVHVFIYNRMVGSKMDSIFEQIKRTEIMNANTILTVQQYIYKKNPDFLSQQKARILADALHKMIDAALPNYDQETKTKIRNRLLQQKLSSTSFSINVQDIVEVSIELVDENDIVNHLPLWLTDKLAGEIEEVETYIKKLIESSYNINSEIAATDDIDSPSPMTILNPLNDSVRNEVEPRGKKWKKSHLTLVTIMIVGSVYIVGNKEISSHLFKEELQIEEGLKDTNSGEMKEYNGPPNDLTGYLQYEQVNETSLRNWLNNRDSLLADEPYFSTILSVAKEFNIHPFLLFAITGQEQSYVPRSNQNAVEIANNPFNVFHSWEDYNTDILNSSQIAARTIVNLSKDRPEGTDPIQWINRKYAEDKNWWRGVSSIFDMLTREVAD